MRKFDDTQPDLPRKKQRKLLKKKDIWPKMDSSVAMASILAAALAWRDAWHRGDEASYEQAEADLIDVLDRYQEPET